LRVAILGALLIAAIASGGGIPSPGAVEAATREQSASLSGEVGAGERHVTRLRNLPQSANLAIDVNTDGRLRVLILDDDQFASLPNPLRPIFTGSGDRRIRFELTVPRTGTYYVVLDNGASRASRSFSLHVQASVGGAQGDANSDSRALAELERFQANLRQTFIFEELTFRIASCEQPVASRDGRTVTLCREVGPLAVHRLGDATKARDVVFVVMLRDVGSALLQQWGFPAADSADVIDQFAVVLHRMYGQAARLDSLVEFFEATDPNAEEDPGLIDVNPGRLQKLKRWIDDPHLVRQWQPFLVERIQTNTLRVLSSQPLEWTDVDAVKEELARR
jgi:hypothetical protein